MSTSEQGLLTAELSDQTRQLVHRIQQLIEESTLEQVPDEVVQQLMTLAVRCYAAKVEAEVPLFPFTNMNALTATEVGVTVGRLIHAAELDFFELAMWQSLR